MAFGAWNRPAGPGFRRSFPVVNNALRLVAARHPHGSAYIDTWHMLASKQGKYTDYLRDVQGELVLMRARDAAGIGAGLDEDSAAVVRAGALLQADVRTSPASDAV